MCCFDETLWAKLPDSQRDMIMDEYGKLVHELRRSGRLLAGAKLDQCASAVTIREKNGKPVIMDGPFTETKEQLGGYHLIECKDRDEAISFAMQIPTLAAGGSIEVRAVLRTD
jgi:hypothetical protein